MVLIDPKAPREQVQIPAGLEGNVMDGRKDTNNGVHVEVPNSEVGEVPKSGPGVQKMSRKEMLLLRQQNGGSLQHGGAGEEYQEEEEEEEEYGKRSTESFMGN